MANKDTIKSTFENRMRFEIDGAFVKRLHEYRLGFANRNEDHVKFFAGNLLGTETVRFTATDYANWFTDILEMDDIALEDELLALPIINDSRTKAGNLFAVATNTFNLSCVWLVHAILNSKILTPAAKQEAAIDVLMVLQYRFITSLLFNYFKYVVNRDLAETTYASLSLKFDIKKYGSWGALIRARAEDVVSKGSIHRKTLETFLPELKVFYVLSDMQGRIRDTIKNIYRVMYEVRETGGAVLISSVSSVSVFEGEEVLKDKSHSLSKYTNYLTEVISDKDSFIKQDLVGVIENLLPAMSPKLFNQTLLYLNSHYRGNQIIELQKYLSDVLVHSFTYFKDHKANMRSNIDLTGLLTRLRGVYQAPRSSDPALLDLRDLTVEYVGLATGNRNSNTVSAVRTGVLLYLVARAVTMQHYTSA